MSRKIQLFFASVENIEKNYEVVLKSVYSYGKGVSVSDGPLTHHSKVILSTCPL